MLSTSAWIAVGVRKHTGEDFRQQYMQERTSLREGTCLVRIHAELLETLYIPP